MKITVIGAGAMGLLYGAYLSRNNEVAMIDVSKEAVESINQNGITVEEKDSGKKFYAKAYLSGEYDDVSDLAIVFVKSPYTAGAIEQNMKTIGKNTVIMTLQNGMGNDRVIAKQSGSENIIAGTSRHNSTLVHPGVCRHGGTGVTVIGGASEEILHKTAAVLKNAGFETEVSDDIRHIMWSKLFINLVINPFTAITGMKNGYMSECPSAVPFTERLIKEAIAVARADGQSFDFAEVVEGIRRTSAATCDGYSSMYQDCKSGRKTEVDAINGAVVRMAEKYGLSAPCNAIVTDIIHSLEDR